MALDGVRVQLGCGCWVSVDDGVDPLCEAHNDRRVRRVKAPVPRITAVDCHAEGPLVRQRG